MEMALEFTVAVEAESAHDADDGGRVGMKTLGHRAYAEQHVVARMLEYRPDNLLAFGAEVFDALRQRRS